LRFSACLALASRGASRTRRTGTGEGYGPKYFVFGRILWLVPTVFSPGTVICIANPAMEKMMKWTLIRYKTKPESADRNAELIAGVFAELKAARLAGVRYLSLRLDHDSFVHFVGTDADSADAIPKLAAFKAFQSGIRDRCVEPPLAGGVTIVGNYRMLGES
jgi:hypothetical protein